MFCIGLKASLVECNMQVSGDYFHISTTVCLLSDPTVSLIVCIE